jgi:MFS transporter, DHA1 family, inner membrane transport protein
VTTSTHQEAVGVSSTTVEFPTIKAREDGTSPNAVRTVNVALATLALVTFVIGTAELMVVGILDLIAADRNVSIGTAGHLVTAYALGIAFGAPIITALTARFGQRAVLRVSIAAFAAGNVVAIVATSFDMLLVARVLTGSLHGLIAGVATAIAAGLVGPERRGHAISLVVGGITIATVVGVPVGTLVGQTLGWQAAFVAVFVMTGVALTATLGFVPAIPGAASSGGAAQARAAFAPRVLAMLAVAVLLMGGQFIAFTYLASFLAEVTHISGGLTSAFLLAFGLAAMAGTLLGGRAADRSATATLLAANATMVAALGALYLVGSSPALVLAALAAWGLAGFALAPAVLLRVITLADAGAHLAPTLGISAFNAGIAAGSLLGGAIISRYGAEATVVTALIVTAVAFPAAWASNFLQAPNPETNDTTSAADDAGLHLPACLAPQGA